MTGPGVRTATTAADAFGRAGVFRKSFAIFVRRFVAIVPRRFRRSADLIVARQKKPLAALACQGHKVAKIAGLRSPAAS